MKPLIAMLLLAVASLVFGQAQSSGAASIPGCGAANIEFNVKTDEKQHPAVPQDATKAHVYFLQDDAEFLSRPRPTTRFGIDGAWVGATHSSSYFYVTIDPGEHHLCASWQGFIGLVPQRREAALHFTAEAGKNYFFRAKNVGKPDTKTPVVLLKPMDSDEGALLISQFAFSMSTPKK
jgi:uncharacterized protein DUF2846